MRKLLLLITLAVTLAGCSWVGTNETIRPMEQNAVDTSKSFYMIYPKSGIEQTFVTASVVENEVSAKDASDVFYKKFYKIFGGLTISESNVQLEDGFKTASTRGDRYLITMDINEWKDSFYITCSPSHQGVSTAQTLDTVDVTVNIYDVDTKNLVNKQRIQNSGCPTVLLGFIPVGKNSPDSRFNSSLDAWFKNLK